MSQSWSEELDRSFYQLAFFTKRKIQPMEELTWDYGTDFSREDPDLPYFECKCESSICRGKVDLLGTVVLLSVHSSTYSTHYT